ncbi:cell filamentation protein Fic [Bacteroidia bacterium]|nr:cell filamentation protein Fic [Bacteroidia bacterium]
MNDFEEYIRQGEPDRVEKTKIWKTAIGLQQVDGLTPSDYLIETAKQNIEGDITFEEVKSRIDTYYQTKTVRSSDDDRTEEADKVSARITELLSVNTFSFSPVAYLNIHKHLFIGIYKFAGKIRDYDITKKEWVLNGATVSYASAEMLRETLEYDFKEEKAFDYRGLSTSQIIEHIAHFIAYLWQIHIFGEGNTRTTAVFLIQYLRQLGYKDINNDLFAQHSWYFRNALVRANYADMAQGIYRTDKYLVRFLSNLLLGENNILKNRELHIKFVENVGVKPQNDTVNTEKFLVNSGQNNLGATLGVNDKKLGVRLGVNQLKMIDIIQSNQNITIVEIAKLLNISTTATENNIKKLKSLGILSREGADKNGHWEIKKPL